MIRAVILTEFTLGALAGWAFVLAYQVRTRGGWRRTATGWHLMTFTATIAVLFTIAVLARVAEIPGIHVIAAVLYGATVAGLLWRLGLLITATKRRKEQP